MGQQIDDNRIASLTEELETIVPRNDAIVALQRVFKPVGVMITANQLGLLRLGVECLRVGLETQGSSIRDSEQLEYLRSGPFSSVIKLQRDDKLQIREGEPPTQAPVKRKPSAFRRREVLLAVGCFAVILCGLVGAFTLVKWLLGIVF